MDWTKEQQDAIYKKGNNILVAAAAGSGKTAVLVERIIQKIIKDNVDINKLLVVTFTNAAAAEIRERVLEAIYKKLDEDPDNENLNRQLVLLSKASICTIHAFCLEVIRNNFYELNISANFRVAAEEEVEIIKQEVIEDVFEKLYDEESKDIEKIVYTYADYRDDQKLKDMVLRIYKFIQSLPFPEEWLNEKVDSLNNINVKDFSETDWGKILLREYNEEIEDSLNTLKNIKEKLDLDSELMAPALVIQDDIMNLEELYNLSKVSWDKTYEKASSLDHKKWQSNRKYISSLQDEAKTIRDNIKKKIKKLNERIMVCSTKDTLDDLRKMYDTIDSLRKVVLEFSKAFAKEKQEKNLVDFNDIEHYALKILLKKDENGNLVKTEVAKNYIDRFEEIAIDEYQDSNDVQELILNTVSRGNNIFMVGDVKQSIYKFRGACPELFEGKYNTYSLDGNDLGLKIQLFKNFRSRQNILDITNIIFSNIMSTSLGDIDYTEEEYLNLGASYEEFENGLGKSEIKLIDITDEQEDARFKDEDDDEDGEEEDDDFPEDLLTLEKEEIEAKYVAKKIEELITNKYQVSDKESGKRDIRYKDIVILLRSTAKTAPIFEKALLERDIPVFSDSSNEYLDTIEIQTIINLLKVLDNPLDDIALVSTLRSKIGNFTDNEITEIRLTNRECPFYESLLLAKESNEVSCKDRVVEFLGTIDRWRKDSLFIGLDELIWKIYMETGFFYYVGLMPNGELRKANLKMLFERAKDYEKTSFKGLFNFIRFIEKLKTGNSDMSSAKVIGENENVVRIMSIHKSKGLEFPVVFLSNVGKKINLQDLADDVLLHKDIGIAPEFIDYERRIKYTTLPREAIKTLYKEETISEEMRVLYVALTRAKEKLIITSTIKDIEKFKNNLKENLKAFSKEENIRGINYILLKKYITYLDWIYLVYLKEKDKFPVSEEVIKKEDVLRDSALLIPEEKEDITFEELDSKRVEELSKKLNPVYEYSVATTIPLKSTVSKIKEKTSEGLEFEDYTSEVGLAEIVPSFISNEDYSSSKHRGTINHLFLEKLDLRRKYSMDDLVDLRNKLVFDKIILEKEAELINLDSILKFTESDLYNEIMSSDIIEKEKTFCLKISADKIYDNASSEEILVQGVIDLYIIKNGEITLVDYKTDRVLDMEELARRYKVQLDLYKQSIEEGLDLKVKNSYIYSLTLNKYIEIT